MKVDIFKELEKKGVYINDSDVYEMNFDGNFIQISFQGIISIDKRKLKN